MAIKTGKELASKCREVAQNYKTLYVLGCFGAPMTEANKSRYCSAQSYNRKAERTAKIKSATQKTFGFDCVCLIKGLLWGWSGDNSKVYGGAAYGSNGVPDINADQMIQKCSGVSTDFSNIQVGEAVWNSGHIGVYIGDGLAVECTPIWKDGVQITAVHNIGTKSGYNGRTWTKHGKLPYVSYEETKEDTKKETASKEESSVSVKLSVLKKGAKGEQVKAVQRMLYSMGYDLGTSKVDGDFGSKTDTAIKAFQKKNGLTADGVVGQKTWDKLLKG